MSGKWTELWDDDAQKWRKVYIEFPPALIPGSATPGTGGTPQLFDKDGKPLIRPRKIGFQP